MITKKLQEITLNITDGKHGDCEGEDNSGYYFISCKDVHDGIIHYDGARQITEKDFIDTHRRTMLEPNDILVTNSGTIGRMALVKENDYTRRTTFQKSVAIVKPNQEMVRPAYLYYCLLNCVNQFVNQSNGSAQKNLLLGTMRNFEIRYEEDFSKQDKVIDVLQSYDNLMENNQRQIKLLEEAAQRLYKEWFIDLRFPGYENTEIIDGIPKGWQKEHIKYVIGKVPRSKQIKASEYLKNGPFPIIDQSRDFIAGYTNDSVSVVKMDKPVIVFGDHTRVLKYIQFPFAKGADGTQLIISNEENLPQSLLYLSLLAVDLSNYHYARHFKYLKEELIFVPTKEVADEFDKIITPVLVQIQKLRDISNKAIEARDRLLPKLMSGELEV